MTLLFTFSIGSCMYYWIIWPQCQTAGVTFIHTERRSLHWYWQSHQQSTAFDCLLWLMTSAKKIELSLEGFIWTEASLVVKSLDRLFSLLNQIVFYLVPAFTSHKILVVCQFCESQTKNITSKSTRKGKKGEKLFHQADKMLILRTW